MPETIRELKKSLEESLDDYLFSRQERREFRLLKSGLNLTNHQKRLLMSYAKDLAISKSDSKPSADLLEWLAHFYSIMNEVEEKKIAAPKVCFSPGIACREAICSQLRFAKNQIDICVFTISDDEITEEILAAHRRKKDIRIITDDEKAFDLGSDIDRIKRVGIKVLTDRSPVHMHHKFALIDNETVLTGSYNWTRSAATHNYENIVLMQDPAVSKAYEQEFDRLWKKLS